MSEPLKKPDALWHELYSQLRILKTVEPEREVVFHPTRKWRFDFAWRDRMLAVEVQGGLFVGGAHNRGGYLQKHFEKMNEAAILGWRVLQFGPEQIRTWQAADTIVRALKTSSSPTYT